MIASSFDWVSIKPIDWKEDIILIKMKIQYWFHTYPYSESTRYFIFLWYFFRGISFRSFIMTPSCNLCMDQTFVLLWVQSCFFKSLNYTFCCYVKLLKLLHNYDLKTECCILISYVFRPSKCSSTSGGTCTGVWKDENTTLSYSKC